MKYDVIVIGSGLGGLECAYILAKNGMKVCVLEQHHSIGGCLQTFKRGGAVFDTGFHYVGGLGEGESLNVLFKYFNLMDLPWQQLDRDNFDEIVLNGKSYAFANGHQNFAANLAEQFPEEQLNIQTYTNFLKGVGDHIFDSFKGKNSGDYFSGSLFAQSAKEFLEKTIKNKELQDILAGASLKMELKDSLPLYTYAQINDSFIRSAWRIKGGGSLIAESLQRSIKKMGGEIRTSEGASKLLEKEGKICCVHTDKGNEISADWVISNVHPNQTLSLIAQTKLIRKIYRKRIAKLENTFGMFTLNISLKEESMPYLNRNIYLYQQADLWNYEDNKNDRALISFYPPEDGSRYCQQLDIICPINYNEVAEWEGSQVGRRGEAYKAMKERKAQELITLASTRLPALKSAIKSYSSSSNLSYENYTKTSQGSAYGIRKDYQNPMLTVLSPKSPIENLLFTGQNLNLHGILGVSMTALFTCSEILGMEQLIKDLDIPE